MTLDDCGNSHTVYGIETINKTISVPDIFTDESTASHFVALCNELDLSPIHIHDVIDDLL